MSGARESVEVRAPAIGWQPITCRARSRNRFLSPFTEPMRGRRVLLALIIESTSTSDAILNGPEQCPTENVLGTTSPLILRHDEDLIEVFGS